MTSSDNWILKTCVEFSWTNCDTYGKALPVHNIFFSFCHGYLKNCLAIEEAYISHTFTHKSFILSKIKQNVHYTLCWRWSVPPGRSQHSEHALHLRRRPVPLTNHKDLNMYCTWEGLLLPWLITSFSPHALHSREPKTHENTTHIISQHYSWDCIKTHEITETLFTRTVINANGIIPIYLSHTRYSGMKKVFEHYGPSYHMVCSSLMGAY